MITTETTLRAEIRALYLIYDTAPPEPRGATGKALCRWALKTALGGGAAVPAAAPATGRTCPTCGKALAERNQSEYCSKHAWPIYNARFAAKHQQAAAAAPTPAPTAAALTAAPIVATATVPTPGRSTVCPNSPHGRHQMARFGGLPLPGQKEEYCIYCEPREIPRRQL